MISFIDPFSDNPSLKSLAPASWEQTSWNWKELFGNSPIDHVMRTLTEIALLLGYIEIASSPFSADMVEKERSVASATHKTKNDVWNVFKRGHEGWFNEVKFNEYSSIYSQFLEMKQRRIRRGYLRYLGIQNIARDFLKDLINAALNNRQYEHFLPYIAAISRHIWDNRNLVDEEVFTTLSWISIIHSIQEASKK